VHAGSARDTIAASSAEPPARPATFRPIASRRRSSRGRLRSAAADRQTAQCSGSGPRTVGRRIENRCSRPGRRVGLPPTKARRARRRRRRRRSPSETKFSNACRILPTARRSAAMSVDLGLSIASFLRLDRPLTAGLPHQPDFAPTAIARHGTTSELSADHQLSRLRRTRSACDASRSESASS